MQESRDIKDLPEKERLKVALDHCHEALCWAFEMDSPEYQAFAFMLDAAAKYGTTILYDQDILDAAANYENVEAKVYARINPESML